MTGSSDRKKAMERTTAILIVFLAITACIVCEIDAWMSNNPRVNGKRSATLV